MEYALFAILMIGSIFTGMQLIRISAKYFLAKPTPTSLITLIPIKGSVPNIEYTMMSLIRKNSWEDNGMTGKFILLDMGADFETIQICRNIVDDNENVYLCDIDRLKDLLYSNVALFTNT